jgi:cytoskeletal protein CcmA (bactofilin family)
MSIGASVVIKGDITGSEDLMILGRVEGDIHLRAGTLTLAPGSHVVGDVTVPVVVINGQVEGTVAAVERIDIRPTGIVKGDVATRSLVVCDGATVNGRVEMPALARPELVESAVRLKIAV